MIDLVRSSVAGQYGAALAMLSNCLELTGPSSWFAPVGTRPLWHVAYHTLFVTDLYLSTTEETFRPQPFHREDADELGRPLEEREKKVTAQEPYDLATLVSYVVTCRSKARGAVAAETEASLAGPSGFSWLPFPRLQLHVYNIRHIQHHTGQMTATLRRVSGVAVPWVGSRAG